MISPPKYKQSLPSISGTTMLPAIGAASSSTAGGWKTRLSSVSSRGSLSLESQRPRRNSSVSDNGLGGSGNPTSLLSSLRKLEEENAHMTAQLGGLRAKYKALQQEHTSLQESHIALQQEHLALRQSSDVLRADLKRARTELSVHRRDADQARQSSLEGFRQLVSLEREASELRQTHVATQARLSELEDEVQELRRTRDSLSERIQDARSERETELDAPQEVNDSNGRRPRAVDVIRSGSNLSESDDSPPIIQIPPPKRSFSERAFLDSSSPGNLWQMSSVHVDADEELDESSVSTESSVTMERGQTRTTRERRTRYLLGKTAAKLKPAAGQA
eukprot:scaffold19603_cov26-Tisochrysis_lutea.AAC.1